MRPRVLIVEDNALVVTALRILLEERGGFEVDAAGGVGEAVAACRTNTPDVMLLDLRLRDGSGFDVLDALAHNGGLPTIIVAVTGDDAPGIRERCLAAGCHDVLVKPINALELPARLKEMIEESGR